MKATTKLTKTTCTRCGGSGHYSFNLKDGTVCYGCNGSGFQMRDLKKDAAAAKRKEAKQAAAAARQELFRRVYWEVINEFNPVYGPFDVTTPLGVDQLNCRVYRALGKGIAQIRDERVKSDALLAAA